MDARFFKTWIGVDSKEVTQLDLPVGELAVICRAKAEQGRTNEDCVGVFSLSKDCAVLVVADGMGGGAQGEVASSIAVQSVGKTLSKLDASADSAEVRAAIFGAIEWANSRVLALGVGAGTTVAIAVVTPERYRTMHAGDSIVLVVGQRGKVKTQTLAHSPVGFAQEAGLIDDRQAMFHHERHVVSNVVGMQDLRIDIGTTRTFSKHDTMILASDGLFDNLTTKEVVSRIRCGPLLKSAQSLVDLASKRMGNQTHGEPSKPDDLGAILFRPRKKP